MSCTASVMKKPLILSLIIIPLLLTALFYYFFRHGTVLYQALGIDSKQQYFYQSEIINSLPSLAHVYSFSLATWLASGRKNGLFSSFLWVIINVAFEFGQMLPSNQLSGFPDILNNYFSNGSFSWFDIAAIFLGGLAAYLTTIKVSEIQT